MPGTKKTGKFGKLTVKDAGMKGFGLMGKDAPSSKQKQPKKSR